MLSTPVIHTCICHGCPYLCVSLLVCFVGRCKYTIAKVKTQAQKVLYVRGHDGGLVTAWLCEPNKNAEPIMAHEMYHLVYEEDVLRDSLGINGIIVRKGSSGNIPLTRSGTDSKIPFWWQKDVRDLWKQLPMYLGNSRNTPEGRMDAAMRLVTYFNLRAGARRVRFGGDLTTAPLAKMDTALLDIHVYFAMLDLNPYDCVALLTDVYEFMSTYWTDVAYGAKFIEEC